ARTCTSTSRSSRCAKPRRRNSSTITSTAMAVITTDRADVLIVGAGVIGLATAIELLQAGRSVRVLDAGTAGGGSSHGNCGTITPSHSAPLAEPGRIARALRWLLTP